MQFQKKTSIGPFGNPVKILIRIALIFIVLLLLAVLVNKINFPYPNKKNIRKLEKTGRRKFSKNCHHVDIYIDELL